MMHRCWAPEPKDRPDFADIVEITRRMRDGGCHQVCNNNGSRRHCVAADLGPAEEGDRTNRAAMAVVQGKLYTVGGLADGSTLATAEAYDPQQRRWEAVAPMAQARHSFGAAAI